MAAETPLAAARRRALTQRFARTAAARLNAALDPGPVPPDRPPPGR
jgi:hypothetical protein